MHVNCNNVKHIVDKKKICRLMGTWTSMKKTVHEPYSEPKFPDCTNITSCDMSNRLTLPLPSQPFFHTPLHLYWWHVGPLKGEFGDSQHGRYSATVTIWTWNIIRLLTISYKEIFWGVEDLLYLLTNEFVWIAYSSISFYSRCQSVILKTTTFKIKLWGWLNPF